VKNDGMEIAESSITFLFVGCHPVFLLHEDTDVAE
jgi:hypothetical protein